MQYLINMMAGNFYNLIRNISMGVLYLCGVLSCTDEHIEYDQFSEAPAALGFRISEIEIQEGTKSAVVEVGISKRIFQEISFQLSIPNHSNEISITDENGSSVSTIGLGPNKATEKLIITAIDDSQYTGNREINLALSNLNGEGVFIAQELLSAQGQRLYPILLIAITDDETPPIKINMKNKVGEILERASNSHVVEVLMSESAPNTTSFEISVLGTAIMGEDYSSSAVNGIINVDVEKGDSRLEIEIQPIDNELIDGDKTVILTIVSVKNGFVIGEDNRYTLTIVDDDSEMPSTIVQLVVDKDAWFRGKPGSNRADENQGLANTLVASQGNRDDDNRQFYLQFDLSNIDITKVSSAMVELIAERDWTGAETANQGQPTTQSVFRIADDWEELTITANNQPEILIEEAVATFTADALVGEVDLENPPIHQYDITSVVKQESDGILSLLFTTVFTDAKRITYSS